MQSANGNNDDKLEKGCSATSANEMVVSDDDSASVNKTLNANSSPSCPSHDTCSFSDDETIIETDQPLFLDATAPVTKNCDDGCAAGEDDAMMAEFLQDTFEPNAVGCRSQSSSTASAFGDVLDAKEMDALLNDENDAIMLLPELCLES